MAPAHREPRAVPAPAGPPEVGPTMIDASSQPACDVRLAKEPASALGLHAVELVDAGSGATEAAGSPAGLAT